MSEDLIKRSDAIKALKWREGILHDTYTAVAIIRSVPSADRPQGEWKSVKASIYPYGYDVECSVCGHRMGSSFGYKFCPQCGARMKGADDE
jgi:hypothetical protein